jgi:hypothetical protein
MSGLRELYQRMSFHIQGVSPHIQHNGRLADPSDYYVVQMSLLHNKKDKTPEIYDQLKALEWEGSLYFDDTMHVVVPDYVLEGALYEAAKKRKLGQVIRSGVFSTERSWRLIFPGDERTVEELRDDPNFLDRRTIVNPSTRGKLMRCRPRFDNWELKFELKYRPDMIPDYSLYEVVRILGHDIGFSDDRKRAGGRFDILVPSEPPEQPKTQPKTKAKRVSKKVDDGEPVDGDSNGEHLEQSYSEDGYVPCESEYDPEPEEG